MPWHHTVINDAHLTAPAYDSWCWTESGFTYHHCPCERSDFRSGQVRPAMSQQWCRAQGRCKGGYFVA